MNAAPVEHLDRRHAALVSQLASVPVDALLVTHRPNISYLTHFTGSAGWLLVEAEQLTLVSDARYSSVLLDLAHTVSRLEVEILAPGALTVEERVAALVAARAPMRLGFEASSLTVNQHQGLLKRCQAVGAEVTLVSVEEAVEGLRQLKDPWEMAILREAGRRLSDVSKCIIPNALAGVPERRLAALIEWELRQKGFDKPAFDTIVAAGPNAALPHHRAGDRVLGTGDLVVVDFGGMYRGYAVDMTRTLTIGPPGARQASCLEAVAAAQQAAFAASRVGVMAEDVDRAARTVLENRGMGEAFSHGLGHGLGLEVHERPRLARSRPGMPSVPLAAGMVFTLEPGVYYPGWGGVRIEDDVVATESGPEWLTEPMTEVRAS
ncbi:MAG TPA: aminopeptidase P family protein [Vicinamibacterales bacterium]|nr:aminopeptidase P family protein [Vicinamibacterales bacterium]